MRLLRELQAYADDQAYLCSDADAIKRLGLPGPFKCGDVHWYGGGVVTAMTYATGGNYADSTNYILLKSLTILPGETFHNRNPKWNPD